MMAGRAWLRRCKGHGLMVEEDGRLRAGKPRIRLWRRVAGTGLELDCSLVPSGHIASSLARYTAH